MCITLWASCSNISGTMSMHSGLYPYLWDELQTIGDPVLLDAVSSNFHQRGDVTGPLLDEPYHEGVLPQAQLLEIGQLNEVTRESLEPVLV